MRFITTKRFLELKQAETDLRLKAIEESSPSYDKNVNSAKSGVLTDIIYLVLGLVLVFYVVTKMKKDADRARK